MNEKDVEDYYTQLDKVRNQFNIVNEELWKEYCNKYLDKILEENKELFIRMKNRE